MPSIQFDSRKVEPNDVFIALPCPAIREHCIEAQSRGAAIVFADAHSPLPDLTGIVAVDDIWSVASKLAKHQYPAQPVTTVAITGTNGKSSVASFISQFWNLLGIPNCCLGTVGLFVNGKKQPSADLPNLTTPDALNLHKILASSKSMNIDHFVFEASSAALDQKRLHSVSLAAAAFLNLASDHLDYHRTHEEYFASKLKLFSDILPNNKPAIVYGDDEKLCSAVKQVHASVYTFGFNESNDIFASNIRYQPDKIIFDLSVNQQEFRNRELYMVGRFQLLNCLAAIALLSQCEIAPTVLASNIHSLKTLDGRMEYITSFNSAKIYIDFAHTSQAFRQCLQELRKLARSGKLICVFGCGGNRDKSKRQEFGSIANELADIAIITDDNPRNEDPKAIRSQIRAACPKALDIGNRKLAIKHAISLLEPNDILAIIGKGHEEYQLYGNKRLPFSDRMAILELCNTNAER